LGLLILVSILSFIAKKIQSYTYNTNTRFIYSEGNKVLFRVALAIIKLNEDKILAIDDPMEIFQVVQVKDFSLKI
jgi:hypothetical protein